jgi:hypothetical protein
LVDTSLAQYKLKKVDNIVLTSNSIGSWADVDNLAAWLPSLSSIRLRDNPLLSGEYLSIEDPALYLTTGAKILCLAYIIGNLR